MRYLGLDVGQKTVGVAVGEQLATELTTLRAANEENFYHNPGRARSFRQLTEIVETENISLIVIGLPVKEDGSHSEESVKIDEYARELEKVLHIRVQRVDETLTSFMARDILEGQGVDPKDIEKRLDQMSAQLILQQYLEEHATT